MKKLILVAGLFCLQPVLRAAPEKIHLKTVKAPMSASDRARAHFKENYGWVQEAEWFNTEDDDMYCMFHQGNFVNRVFYDQKGYWQFTLIEYPPAGLAKNVREQVSASFPDYHINYVNEVRSDYYEPVYMISIEDNDNIKVIRVSDDGIQVMEDLKKI